MRDVNIIKTLLDEYTNEELICMVSKNINYLVSAAAKSEEPEKVFVRNLAMIAQTNDILKGVSTRIRGGESGNSLV